MPIEPSLQSRKLLSPRVSFHWPSLDFDTDPRLLALFPLSVVSDPDSPNFDLEKLINSLDH